MQQNKKVRRSGKRGPFAVAALVVASLYCAGLLLWALLHALLGDRFWWTFLLNTFALYLFVPLPAAPFNQVGLIDGAWLLLGIIVVVLLSLRAPQILQQGSKLFAEEKEPAA